MNQVPTEFFARCSPDDPGAQRVGFEYFRFHDSECLALFLKDYVPMAEKVWLERELRDTREEPCADCDYAEAELTKVEKERDDLLKRLEAAQARIAELEGEYNAKEHQAA